MRGPAQVLSLGQEGEWTQCGQNGNFLLKSPNSGCWGVRFLQVSLSGAQWPLLTDAFISMGVNPCKGFLDIPAEMIPRRTLL